MRRSHGAIASCFYHAQGTAKEIFWLLLTYLFQSLKGVYPRSLVTNKMDNRDARRGPRYGRFFDSLIPLEVEQER
jgi:hypothetical protein